MKYKVISNSRIEQVERQVNEHLALGWKLHGSPMMRTHELMQAMVEGEPVRPARAKERQAKMVKKDPPPKDV